MYGRRPHQALPALSKSSHPPVQLSLCFALIFPIPAVLPQDKEQTESLVMVPRFSLC